MWGVELLAPLAVGVFVGPVAGYLGSIMVSKRMSLVGDALSHVAPPGLALGIMFHFNPFLGAFAFLTAVMLATWQLQKSTAIPVDAIIGVLFVLAVLKMLCNLMHNLCSERMPSQSFLSQKHQACF